MMTDFIRNLMEITDFSTNWLRSLGTQPRVHGNGFIQLDISDQARLHIWGHPNIPRQTCPTPIHDHVFGFESYCLVGRITNVVYDIRTCQDFGDFQIHNPEIREGEDTVLKATGQYVDICPVSADVSVAPHEDCERENNFYRMERFAFHETFVCEPTATIIIKDGTTQAQGSKMKPRVLVPIGRKPDNEFNRYDAPTEMLWAIIKEVINV